jgi:hypothetical protein
VNGYAYASVASGGEPQTPDRMVTHNWDNRFVHLLAAVIADACEVKQYQEIADLLAARDFEELKRRIGVKIDRVYWICAFSVNQHVTICHQAFCKKCMSMSCSCEKVDSLGDPIALCRCSMEAIRTGPLCEVNKFDDMMSYLKKKVRRDALKSASPSQRDHRFGQVIACDVEFTLLKRVWCIAELYEAEEAHLDQKMKIYTKMSQSDQSGTLEMIRSLDVGDAGASFPADKDFVLGKIDDIDRFNAQVRSLVVKKLRHQLGATLHLDLAIVEALLG